MSEITPITIRSTDSKFLCDFIDWISKYKTKDSEKYLMQLHNRQEFDFENDSGNNLIDNMAIALKNANQRLAKMATTGDFPTIDEWSYTQQTVSDALRAYEKIHGKVEEQPNLFPE